MNTSPLANLLGALALALQDAQAKAAREACGLGDSGCAALVSLGPYPGTTIGGLAKILGLTHSVAVRLVDHLAHADLIERGAGADRRQVALRLSERGTLLREQILAARAAVLAAALGALPAPEQQAFHTSVAAILTGLTDGRATADHICRMCDEEICTAAECPVEQAARACERSAS